MSDFYDTNDSRGQGRGNSSKNSLPPSSEERFAVYSLLTGAVGILFSCCFPSGAAFGIFGVTLALLSRNASEAKEKHFSQKALIGLILSLISLALTFFICFLLGQYFQALRDPEIGPYLNDIYTRLIESMDQFSNFQTVPQ